MVVKGPNLFSILVNLIKATKAAKKKIGDGIAQRIPSGEQIVDAALNANQAANTVTSNFLKSVTNLTKQVMTAGKFSHDDFHVENFPFKELINNDIESDEGIIKKINPILNHYKFDNYSNQNVVKFFNENTVYPSITDSGEKLESLKDFGISHDRTGIRATLLALTTKHLVRKNVSFILENGIPHDPNEANKAISFLIFAFANHKLLLGDINHDGANHAPRYREYIRQAVNKDNILPLALIRKFTSFSFKNDIFAKRTRELEGLKFGAANSQDPDGKKIADYIENGSLEKTFPEIFDTNK